MPLPYSWINLISDIVALVEKFNYFTLSNLKKIHMYAHMEIDPDTLYRQKKGQK